MPASVGLVNICCALYQHDFWQEGRNAARMGVAGLSVDEAKAIIRDERSAAALLEEGGLSMLDETP
jgi:hypothetical protein